MYVALHGVGGSAGGFENRSTCTKKSSAASASRPRTRPAGKHMWPSTVAPSDV
jgi:hypothetical protein